MLTESHISFRRPVKAESRKPRTQQLKPKMPCWDEVVIGTPQTGRMLTESHISFRRPVKAESRKPRTQQLKPKMPCWDEVVNGVFGVDGVRTVPAREAMLARKVYNFITRHFGH
jgi:hypothetical protein